MEIKQLYLNSKLESKLLNNNIKTIEKLDNINLSDLLTIISMDEVHEIVLKKENIRGIYIPL